MDNLFILLLYGFGFIGLLSLASFIVVGITLYKENKYNKKVNEKVIHLHNCCKRK